MRTAEDWPPGKVLLRDTALTLFAERGVDGVSVRDVASAAGVSPGLVVHHFGTKDALRQAVDDHVFGLMETMLEAAASELDPGQMAGPDAGGLAAGIAGLFAQYLPPDSPVPAYVRRLLMSGDAGRALFRRWFDMTVAMIHAWTATGLLRPTSDPEAMAAFLLLNDLAVFLMRDQVTEVLGVDPMGEGIERWSRVVMETYAGGVLAPPPGGAAGAAHPQADD
ncbi:MAG: TetR/AcrR family transcriptional regulator; helix-turn-helix transcriptional regulator [Actinomycetales bacterium]|nr:TetR/AcrR family transcriptional regulator; helix-turn-helix transcriptional regulator [Actinomycetales bacterium]